MLVALALGAVAAQPAMAQRTETAQVGQPVTIFDIRVEGAQRIEPATIESYLTIRRGEPLTQEQLDESLTSLFATGLFADVTLRLEGSTLVIQVRENPIINRIAFEGNNRIDDETLTQEVQLRPRVVYTRTRVQNDVARIVELYRRSGRFAATVEPKIIELDQNRVDLVFEIDEGPLTGVQRITFVGNRAFSDAQLREEIQTAESRWWKVLTTDDTYDPDRIAVDRELLRRFYLSEGYADFRVVSAVAELSPDQEEFFITFTVEEGERYAFGTIEIESQLANLNVEALRNQVTTVEGDWYSSEDVEESIQNLTQAVGDLQYAFVDVRPLVSRDREARRINVTYQINEGPRVFVERIDIRGNVRTIDPVIRREFELVEGDPFSSSKLERSEARIRNLGFFERVDVEAVPGAAADQTVINVAVQERSTGELSLGAGFSTAEGPIGDVSLRERNLLGRGQDLRLRLSISGERQQVDLSFTEPYFLDRDLAAGFDLFRIQRDNQDESSYDEFNTGGAIRLGYPLTENLRQTVRLRVAERTVENIPSSASVYIKAQEGTTLTTSLRQDLTYDRLDSRIEPTDGYILRFGTEIAGLVGDVSYFQTTVGGNIYFPIFDEWVLSFGAEAGYIVGLGEDVGINDRFFVGGTNLRGFRQAGIGPRDGNGDALGGNLYAVGSIELTFPLGLPEEFGLKGRTFTDFGYLGMTDDEEIPGATGADVIHDSDSIRVSAGVGLSWDSPFGPIRLDYAFPLVSEDFDRTENFRFSFGTTF